MIKDSNQTSNILALAVSIGLLFHGASFFSTLEDTYDIYVHIFFADHYGKSWFDPWETRWYTGFNLTSYPPLVHQLIAIFAFVGGLKFSAYFLAFCIVVLYVSGSYRFAKLICVNKESAAYASLIAVFLPSVVEAFHVFGQIPMMMGISWLLHSLPEIFKYIRYGKFRYFLNGISLIAAAVCSHHVTPIFGMVFFVVPLMGTAVMDGAKAEAGSYKQINLLLFIKYVRKYLGRIVFFGFMTILVAVFVILPYWISTKNDPISQVPIPHGSRDNFIEVFSSGLVFFIIPWGFLLLMLPFYFYRYFSKRNIFLGFSFLMLTILGTGGTTPIPKMLLGENAFNILTLERFTFWATIYAMPLTGEFLWRFVKGDLYDMITSHRSLIRHSLYVSILVMCIFFSSGFTMNLGFFRPMQPKPIELTPIKNFLQSDKHYKWRFLTLGFGDQMAWLSANTEALTIDGNYHSARRVPELTTRAVERLENAKYKGIEGIATLHQFLGSPETFHLKYIFSNDKFYDPMLYFMGWHRVKHLSNGIMAWERSDVSSLPATLPKKNTPTYQKILWGTIPLITLLVAFFFNVQLHWINHISGSKRMIKDSYENPEKLIKITHFLYNIIKYWVVFILILAVTLIGYIYLLNVKQLGAERVLTSYYDALDFKEYEMAHSYLDPKGGLSLDQYLLESSVSDGIVDSYGKINSIKHTIIKETDKYARIRTDLEWITPLETYEKSVIHEVVKYGWKWYIKPTHLNNYIPTDQFSDIPNIQFINQGKRTVSTQETFHEDVLDRPVVHVSKAKLVEKDKEYHVIGLIQNLDGYPADLTIKASLTDSSGQILTSYFDKYHVNHKLMPKEVTPFRIDFDDVIWSPPTALDSLDSIAAAPRQAPVTFRLEVLASVATQDLYKSVVIQDLGVTDKKMSGQLYNYGQYTSTITQVLRAYFDRELNLIWVDDGLTEKSIFPKKRVEFSIPNTNLDSITVHTNLIEPIITVNGLFNELISQKYKSNISVKNPIDQLMPISDDNYVQLYLNNFTGNPVPF